MEEKQVMDKLEELDFEDSKGVIADLILAGWSIKQLADKSPDQLMSDIFYQTDRLEGAFLDHLNLGC
ncbi:hypothetical protein COT75_02580 [Candidatus Beckwithbacteria bacterium CG10_big_fil_rev_8_21_14_0_10_34_10]|uniref:Uncharacterized protein n=1 Tax=Candidatus Beckwithbacteria bacterium CG10_big_fil_rev_8_21_14_0_10_34_10 TaxID=1974495 RepID=A0A2H0WBE8_9BACT|nr:MAG: hypothetical protein COT75_02580 [Candidatus Beckwithbacteria bacterium CG10_big_fil_rev_8_21_14_0_10_34_10]